MLPCGYAYAVSEKDKHQNSETKYRTAQVVENLPAADGVHLILHLVAVFVTHGVFQPTYYLPVAAGPAVVTFGVVDVVGGVVVEQLEVIDKSATYVAALDKVVAEDEVLGESAFQHLLEHMQVVDALAAERAFVEDILIKLETGGGIYVETAQSGEELCVAAFVGNLHIHVHTRLHNAVAGIHATAVVAELGAVERMRHGANEFLCRVKHQLGVGVEGDDELYWRHGAFEPLADGLATETFLRLGGGGVAQHKVVEMQYGATFALVAEPCVLAFAPGAFAIHEIEDRCAVFLVEFTHFLQSCLSHLVVPGRVGLFVGGGVADKGVEKVLRTAFQTLSLRSSVDIAKMIDLQLFEQLYGFLLVFQYGRHYYHGGVLLGDKSVLELYLESAVGLVQFA